MTSFRHHHEAKAGMSWTCMECAPCTHRCFLDTYIADHRPSRGGIVAEHLARLAAGQATPFGCGYEGCVIANVCALCRLSELAAPYRLHVVLIRFQMRRLG